MFLIVELKIKKFYQYFNSGTSYFLCGTYLPIRKTLFIRKIIMALEFVTMLKSYYAMLRYLI